MAEKGLMVDVLRSASGYDCTNGGVSAKAAHLTLLANGRPDIEVFAPTPDRPAVYLARWMGRWIAVPENVEVKYPKVRNERDDCSIEHLGSWMFGGNFVYTSDSRLPCNGPVFVYDRREF